MRTRRFQRGSVLVISLVILLVMTFLGVSAMTGSGLQERMVSNQKQVIEASMAAEAGAISVIQWLRAHPEAWGDTQAWKADDTLPSQVVSVPNFGPGAVYWIESIQFNGDVATITSRGGVLVADKIMGRSAIVVTLQNEDYGTDLVHNVNIPTHFGISTGVNQNRGRIFSGSAVQMIGKNNMDTDNASAINGEPGNGPLYSRSNTISSGLNGDDQETAVGKSTRTREMRGKITGWKQIYH